MAAQTCGIKSVGQTISVWLCFGHNAQNPNTVSAQTPQLSSTVMKG